MFKPIPGYENYSVNENGVVINNKTCLELKQYFRKSRNSGYNYVYLYNKDGRKFMLVHRLLALTFIPNPSNLPQVNHKDENTLNNKVSNLEWCTAKYNCLYGHHIEKIQAGLKSSGKFWEGRSHTQASKEKMSAAKLGKPSLRKRAVVVNGKIEIDSLTECAKYLGLSVTQVYNLVNGIRKSKEYTIQYKEDIVLCTNV